MVTKLECAGGVGSSVRSHSSSTVFRKHCAKRSVCLAEPSVPSAPLGGRLREADTRPCLVVGSAFVASTLQPRSFSAILGWRRGRHTHVPSPVERGSVARSTLAAR